MKLDRSPAAGVELMEAQPPILANEVSMLIGCFKVATSLSISDHI